MVRFNERTHTAELEENTFRGLLDDVMLSWHARRFKAYNGRGWLICSLGVEERGGAIYGTEVCTSETTVNDDSRVSNGLISSADILSVEMAITRSDGNSRCGED
jgi:hypothetical protein